MEAKSEIVRTSKKKKAKNKATVTNVEPLGAGRQETAISILEKSYAYGFYEPVTEEQQQQQQQQAAKSDVATATATTTNNDDFNSESSESDEDAKRGGVSAAKSERPLTAPAPPQQQQQQQTTTQPNDALRIATPSLLASSTPYPQEDKEHESWLQRNYCYLLFAISICTCLIAAVLTGLTPLFVGLNNNNNHSTNTTTTNSTTTTTTK